MLLHTETILLSFGYVNLGCFFTDGLAGGQKKITVLKLEKAVLVFYEEHRGLKLFLVCLSSPFQSPMGVYVVCLEERNLILVWAVYHSSACCETERCFQFGWGEWVMPCQTTELHCLLQAGV